MPPAHSRPHQPVKVKVEAISRTAQTPLPPASAKLQTIQPPAPANKINRLKSVKIPKPKLPRVEQWSVHHRRRLMWGVVATVMIVIVGGWAFFLGGELRQPFGGHDLLKEVADTFKSFKIPTKSSSPVEQEIRALDKQVFPQFQ